ncbi:MAG TPA: serine protease [Cryomorphaceae bacterium]|nr:serine protease [Cryomorphaceae bacterium]
MKKFFSLLLAFMLALPLFANEGMWLPLLLNRNFAEMQKLGLQLTPEELYSVNNSSLKDAIVSFGGFCTGEIISPNGLILTNHHCGYSSIQSHSSVENDYLSDGFWAHSYSEEKPNEGLFVRFLVRMEDVSERVNTELTAEMTESERDAKIAEISKQIADEAATEENGYEANVKSFYHGNEFYLFVYERYNDVRLVGAPPSSIGKFGGDTDNWMWPRHTGDFSLFRVYTAPDGSPADYSEENIPMKPKHYLPVSLDGVKEGDFTMIFGYPGSTARYLSSYGVKQAIDKYNPTVVKIRDRKLEIMKKYMDADPATRIAYSSKYAQTSNYWKYYIGQTEQLKNNKVWAKKRVIEDDFSKWVSADPARQKKYGETLNLLEDAYQASDKYVVGNVYVLEAGLLGSDLTLFAFRFDRLMQGAFATREQMEQKLDEAENDEERKQIKEEFEGRVNAIMANLNAQVEEHFAGYNKDMDRERFAALFQMYYDNVPKDQQPEFFRIVEDKYDGNFYEFAEKVYDDSFLASKEEVLEYLEKPKEKTLKKDYAAMAGRQLYNMYRNSAEAHAETDAKMEKGYRLLTAGLRAMNPDHNYSPDANSTMRMTYGTVGSYYPRDGVFYNYYTTAEGILQKENEDDMEFVVPSQLISKIEEGNYGRYANSEGELPVCFISNNDITGGNSGSPVINGKGELIGCAFDGNWEAMSGDIFFEKNLQRTISVDARYILFVIDKYAGAKNLVDEMTLVKSDEAPVVEKDMPREAQEVMN